jgi:hypothetical protein
MPEEVSDEKRVHTKSRSRIGVGSGECDAWRKRQIPAPGIYPCEPWGRTAYMHLAHTYICINHPHGGFFIYFFDERPTW